MRLTLRLVNVAVALVTLASALAVLISDLAVPGYREHYGDAVWFVAAYCAIQVVILVEFARDGRWVPWLAVAKAVVAFAFIAGLIVLWPRWRVWTPARYVYALFDWGDDTRFGLFAVVFLGRGAFNTLNAFYFTSPWWRALRVRRPLLGRLVTALPLAAIVTCVWAFLELVRQEARTFSPEAEAVARTVLESLDCATVRDKSGQTTTDLRRRGERNYQVRIYYDCTMTKVVVRDEDGGLGSAAAARPECCASAG